MSASEDEHSRLSDDEGSGDDLMQQKPFDSSEEEEEDDEEEMQKVKDGFIVDDEDEDAGPKRKKKHKRRHEKREDDALLDEDDLDLVMENNGQVPQKSKSKFKRLKKAAAPEEPVRKSGIDDFFSDDDDEEMTGAGEGAAPTRSIGRQILDELDESDDFIEDDEEEDMDEADREEHRRRRKQERLRPTEITGIASEKIDELYDIFGDGEDYAWALEGEDADGEYHDEDVRPQLQDIYEPEELKARMLTDSDKLIRDTDVPERYQMIRNSIKEYELDDVDYTYEKTWIAHKLMEEKKLKENIEFDEDVFTNAVGDVLDFICKENMDVPFISSHRRDYLLKTDIIGEGDEARTEIQTLLEDEDLWRMVQLDVEYHALVAKRNTVNDMISYLHIDDELLNTALQQARSLTDLQDCHDFINFQYSHLMRDVGMKRAQKTSIFDKVKNNRIFELVQAIGITANEFAENVISGTKIFVTTDPTYSPTTLAEDICMDDGSLFAKTSQTLDVAKRYYAEQIYTHLSLRSKFRNDFLQYATARIVLTEQGRLKIDKNSSYADFKYAVNRSHDSFRQQPDLFLRMLEAESQHLVEIKFELADSGSFFDDLFAYLSSDSESDIAHEWNSFRRDALNIALKKLIPHIVSNIKEDIRRECERLLFFDVRAAFLKKIDHAPFTPPEQEVGYMPRVFAVSAGNCLFGKDAVVASIIDEEGKVTDTFKFVENPRTPADRLAEGETSFDIAFADAVRETQPDVIVVNGFNTNTNKLQRILLTIIEDNDIKVLNTNSNIPVIYVNDEVALRYQNSQRAMEEFPDKTSLVRYTIALARYTQSPLLEYVNLGDEVLSLAVHKHQGLLSQDKFKEAIDTAFVDIVSMTGIDINRCVSDSYLAASLKYVSGLGDRKAFGLLRAVQQHPLFSRQSLITNDNISIGATIFLNCASFLRIPQSKTRALRHSDEIEAVTPLDDTRIHPEDYALAEKIAADAMDYDEEKVAELADAPPGETIIDNLVSYKDRGASLLDALVLEDYSRQLLEAYNKKKRATLHAIVDELVSPYEEIRKRFEPLNAYEIFESLSGESIDDFREDVVVPVVIKKVNDFRVFALTASRIECNADVGDCRDPTDPRRLGEIFQESQTVPAKLRAVNYIDFTADIILRPKEVQNSPERLQFSRDPAIWDVAAEYRDMAAEHQQKEEQKKQIRVINHPLFRPYNSAQAQNELAPQAPGSVIIRPSSLGNNHVAITWKVATNLYQHINVVEHEKENDYSMGKRLTIGDLQFHDLDEILNAYVYEIAKHIQQMTQHDKFRTGSKDEVSEWIERYSKANPNRVVYCFAYDYRKPGSFLLMFKTGPSSKLYTWSVKATPEGFELRGYAYPSMITLCNGFKSLLKNNPNQPPQAKPQSQSRYGGNGSSYQNSRYQGSSSYTQNYGSQYASNY